MTVYTKFNVGDTVFFLADNKVREYKICAIEIKTAPCGTSIEYVIDCGLTTLKKYESALFKTKQELIESL